jgi:dephospho-CoA kinase
MTFLFKGFPTWMRLFGKAALGVNSGINRLVFRVFLDYNLCMKVIGLVGEKLAGKDEVAKFLQKKYGVFHIKFSHLLDEILNILDEPISRRNEIDLGLGLRKIFGPNVLFNALKKKVESAGAGLIVVNGIRMDEQEKVIKELGAKIIYITAPSEIRFKRYQSRHEKTDDGKMDFEQFKEQEKEATEIGIPLLGAKADYRIDNIGSKDDLYKKVDEIVKEIKM